MFPDGAERGWGGVVWRAYGEILPRLATETWPEEVRRFVRFEIHACGYDWRGSTAVSGKRLAEYIVAVRKKHPNPGKVILVTHSMGGIVARAAMKLHGAAQHVMAAIHGVQPATGAPVAYWRMRAGFARSNVGEWIAARALAPGAIHAQATVGHCQGALELFPGRLYRDNRGNPQWVTVTGPEPGQRATYPQQDPFAELYLSKSPVVGMVNPAYLTGNADATEGQAAGTWQLFERKMKSAKGVLDALADWQLPGRTYNIFGTQLPTVDRIEIDMKLQEKGVSRHLPIIGPVISDVDESGGLVKYLPHSDSHELRMTMAKHSTSSGDATVPESSGSFLGKQAGSVQSWAVPGAEHEKALGPAGGRIVEAVTDIVRKELAKLAKGS